MPLAITAAFMGIRRYYNRPGLLTVLNGLTFVYSLPLVLVAMILSLWIGKLAYAPLLIALLLGVLPNPFAAGLQSCARLAAFDDPLAFEDLMAGLRQYWRPAAVMFGVSLVSLLLIVVNILFYATLRSPIFVVLDIIWTYFLFTWFMAHVHVYPMLFALEQRNVLLVYRNSIVLAFKKPFTTFFVMAFWLVWLVLASYIGLIVVAGLVVSAIIQQTVTTRAVSSAVRSPLNRRSGPVPASPDSSAVGTLPGTPSSPTAAIAQTTRRHRSSRKAHTSRKR